MVLVLVPIQLLTHSAGSALLSRMEAFKALTPDWAASDSTSESRW